MDTGCNLKISRHYCQHPYQEDILSVNFRLISSKTAVQAQPGSWSIFLRPGPSPSPPGILPFSPKREHKRRIIRPVHIDPYDGRVAIVHQKEYTEASACRERNSGNYLRTRRTAGNSWTARTRRGAAARPTRRWDGSAGR
jgi:hypothetical protein